MTMTRWAGLVLAGVLAAGAAPADVVPLGDEQIVNVSLGWTQDWVKVALQPDGSRFAVAYETPVTYHEILVRFFDGDGVPTSAEIQANSTSSGRQDEPMAAMDAAGNLLVCWSDRGNNDGGVDPGGNMGCFGQLFTSTGAFWGPEIQINEQSDESQWEPMPVALPGGGWVVAFNGDDDGNAYLRFFDVDGTPRTGDVPVNTYLNNGQTEAECAVASDGTVLAVYADFGANVQAGTGTNLLARRFTEDGVALDPVEFVVNDSTLDFDQLEPRLDADGANTYVMVWEDHGHDGDGTGVWARRYDTHGTALGPEWRVHEVAVGDQRLPEVAVADDGRFVVTWEDHATGSGRILARLYDADAQPAGPSFVVSGDLVGDYLRPQVALDAAGTRAVFTYTAPSNSGDAALRLFAIEDGGPSLGDGRRVGSARPSRGQRPAPAPAPGPLPSAPGATLP